MIQHLGQEGRSGERRVGRHDPALNSERGRLRKSVDLVKTTTHTHTHTQHMILLYMCPALLSTYEEREQVTQAKAAHEANHALLVGQGRAHGTDFLRGRLFLGARQHTLDGLHGGWTVRVCSVEEIMGGWVEGRRMGACGGGHDDGEAGKGSRVFDSQAKLFLCVWVGGTKVEQVRVKRVRALHCLSDERPGHANLLLLRIWRRGCVSEMGCLLLSSNTTAVLPSSLRFLTWSRPRGLSAFCSHLVFFSFFLFQSNRGRTHITSPHLYRTRAQGLVGLRSNELPSIVPPAMSPSGPTTHGAPTRSKPTCVFENLMTPSSSPPVALFAATPFLPSLVHKHRQLRKPTCYHAAV